VDYVTKETADRHDKSLRIVFYLPKPTLACDYIAAILILTLKSLQISRHPVNYGRNRCFFRFLPLGRCLDDR